MQKYYNDDKRQPTAEWIDYNFYESTDNRGRFIFINKVKRGNNSHKGDYAGGYNVQNGNVRYTLRFDGIFYNNASKLLWILKNNKPWPTNQNGKHFVLDHIDGNTQNNFISNIRPATSNQNNINAKLRFDNTSGYKGVSWDAYTNKWKASCRFNNVLINIGRYDTKEEAAFAYNMKVLEIFGEYAILNIMEDG